MSTQPAERCLFALCEHCDGTGLAIVESMHVASVPENHGRVMRVPRRPARATCPRCLGTRYRPVAFGLHEAAEAIALVRVYRERFGEL